MKSDEIAITVTLLFSIEMILKSFIGLLNGIFQAFEEGKYQDIGNILLNTVLIIFILISIIYWFRYLSIAISYIVANFIAWIFLYYVFRKKIAKPKFKLDIPFIISSFCCSRVTDHSLLYNWWGDAYKSCRY